jgi:hypothetical protein
MTEPSHASATFKNATLKVKTESLDCGNAVMNTNLCSTMHGDKYPYIVVDLLSVSASDGKPMQLASGKKLSVKTYITLAGQKKLNILTVQVNKNDDGTYRFTGTHKITLSSYGLEPPRAFFGLIKVNDAITIQFDLLVHAQDKMVQ